MNFRNLLFSLQLLRVNVAQLQRGENVELGRLERHMRPSYLTSYLGICDCLETIVDFYSGFGVFSSETLPWLYQQFPLWPHYSGAKHYPVPSGNEFTPYFAFHNCQHGKWAGEYGSMRINLLDFLIVQAEKHAQQKSNSQSEK